ncbi:MAG: hypothetical protein GTO26_11110 [Planctomycetales bacterium]|nr:hypothetical protein [Planctomycetales bacterium]
MSSKTLQENANSLTAPTRQQRGPWFRRHKFLALLSVNLFLLLALTLLLELVFRLTLPYSPGYYHAFNHHSDTELEYEWGLLKINSLGFADEDFDLSKTVRIGYVGDSVTNGVGCGYGYRFTELLENAYPDFLHANLGKSGSRITSYEGIEQTLDVTEQLGLTTVVYAFNLNDIVPDSYGGKDSEQPAARRTKLFVKRYLDWLRGRSYLYSSLRSTCKSLLMKSGIGIQGYPMAELFPQRYEDTVKQAAQRVNRLRSELHDRNIKLVVLLLPYEMQISERAEKTYAAHDIQWDPEFISGATQQMLIQNFDKDVHYIDLLHAFVNSQTSRVANDVGEYFVYDKGDRLDWNHPNRKGHRKIAEFLIRQDVFAGHDLDSQSERLQHSARTK